MPNLVRNSNGSAVSCSPCPNNLAVHPVGKREGFESQSADMTKGLNAPAMKVARVSEAEKEGLAREGQSIALEMVKVFRRR